MLERHNLFYVPPPPLLTFQVELEQQKYLVGVVGLILNFLKNKLVVMTSSFELMTSR